MSAHIARQHDNLLAVHGALELAAHQIDDRLMVVGMQRGTHAGGVENLEHDHLLALLAQLDEQLSAIDGLSLERADPDRFGVGARLGRHACLLQASMFGKPSVAASAPALQRAAARATLAAAMSARASRHRIYLAGPEVFLPNAREVGEGKRRIAAEAGFEGVFPLDNALDLAGLSKTEQARR